LRRTVLYISLIVIAAAAITMYRMAHRSFAVKRAMIGGPIPRIPPHESLIGRMAPDFAGVDQEGRAISTASLRGQVVMLNVWATWCKPCVEELPRIEKEIWRRFQPRVVVVGVALGERPERIRDFNRQLKLTFPLVADPDSKISRRFGADHRIPQTFVIGRSGVVAYETIGYDAQHFDRLASAVERALAQP
jgi:peroxiredoxin